MTAREYLQQVRRDLVRREEMEEEIQRLHSMAYPPCAFSVKDVQVQERAPYDRMSEALAEVDAKIREYREEIGAIRRRRVQAMEWIEKIEKASYRHVLEQYYLTPITCEETISGYKRRWAEPRNLDMVAWTMRKSSGWIRHIHREAIKAFAEKSGLPI